jgi:cytochrome c oxidase cbb3-type subunit III
MFAMLCKMRMKLLWLPLMVCCFTAGQPATGQEAVAGAPRRGRHGAPQPSEAAKRGREQFQKTCSFCHGPDANGTTSGPNLLRSALVRHDENGNLIGPLIHEGRPDKGMPAFQLTADQIQDIVAFLRFRLAQSDGRSPRRPGAFFTAARVVVGDAQAGRAFFHGPGGCASCHSPTGDLAGIASKYSAVDLQARFLYPADLHPVVVVTDSSGKQLTGRLRLLTHFDIAIEDSDGWYHSWPADSVKIQIEDRLAAHRRLLYRYTDSDMHNILAYLETLQ